MKKIPVLLLCSFILPLLVSAQSFTIHIKNSAHIDLIYSYDVQHGQSGMLPGQLPADQSVTLYFSPNPLTGVEGMLNIYPLNQPGERTYIYYDNPLIGTATYQVWSSNLLHCKPLKWGVLNNTGSDGELSVEITNPGSMYGKPVPVALSGNATIRGSVFWNLNDIQSPESNPFGNAFEFRAMAPTQFVESTGPFTIEKTGSYNGKNGFFQGAKQVGTVTFETVPSFNPNYAEIRYTITGVPSGIPLELDVVTDYTKSKWIAGPMKPKPADDYVFVVGTFPSTIKTTITIDNNLSQINGVDFSCDGDWFKLDANGKLTGGGAMVNKIAARKNSPVLPGNGMITVTRTDMQSNQVIQAPAQNKAQTMQVQKVKTAGAVKIRQ